MIGENACVEFKSNTTAGSSEHSGASGEIVSPACAGMCVSEVGSAPVMGKCTGAAAAGWSVMA